MRADAQKVLVFYGRNERIRMDVFAFLRAIGLDPIEWTKAVEMTGKASPYVGEILDAALDNAQAIVVVMTPDDEAKLRDQYIREEDPEYENILTPQSRPNVLFEAGLALGRSPNQTILVEIGDLRPFSDIAGRHTIRLDNSPEKRLDLATRLKTAGCQVDTDGKTDWQTVGDFTIGPDEATTITIPPNREIALPGFQFLPSRGILERVRGGLEKELEDAETVWLAWSTGDVARGKQTMSADEIRKKVERLILIDYVGRYPEIHAPLFGTTPRTMRELIRMAVDAMCPLLKIYNSHYQL